jgi:membrane associated rhomboid family serine protease
VKGDRERIINLPGVVTAVILVLAAVQLVLEALPDGAVMALVERFAFIPARLTFIFAPGAVLRALAQIEPLNTETDAGLALILNDAGRAWSTPLTYALLHGNWTHLAINCLTLAAFGAPLARRFGPFRFLVFLAVCAVAGALAHLIAHPFDTMPVIGASAAISGTMAAVARFAFTPGAPLGERRFSHMRETGGQAAALSLSELASNQRAVVFLVTWFLVNLLFGLFPQAGGASAVIAWEAHIGGFLAGLLLFGRFDPRRP